MLQCSGFRFLIKYARAGGLRDACFGVFDPLGSLGAPWGLVRQWLWAYLLRVFFAARCLLCTCWFLLAIATSSECPRGWVLMTLWLGPGWFRGIGADCSGVARVSFALASCCLARAAFSSKQNFLIFFWVTFIFTNGFTCYHMYKPWF